MGHAFKILLIVGDHVEILHYTEKRAADDAFDALGDFMKVSKKEKISSVKLYNPDLRSRRNYE